MKMHTREVIACGAWVAAAALMLFGSLDTERAGHNSPFLAWGVFCAIVAAVTTLWCIIEKTCTRRDESSVEDIIKVVDALHVARSSVSKVR